MRGEDGAHRSFQLQQLTLTEGGVSHVACYFDTSLFEAFGLPEVLGGDAGAAGQVEEHVAQ
jgi:RNA polymerase sigma-70 factor, ECF subfamily